MRGSIRALAVCILLVAACAGPMTEAQAREAALDYFVMTHAGGVAEVQVTETRATTRGTAAGWEVAVDGLVLEAGTVAYRGALVLFINSVSGEVEVLAQG